MGRVASGRLNFGAAKSIANGAWLAAVLHQIFATDETRILAQNQKEPLPL
jgi:hypothetical protein